MALPNQRPDELVGPQIIHTPSGDEMVILPKAAFDALVARLAGRDPTEAEEEAGVARIVAATNGQTALSAEAWDRIDAGQNPLLVIRRERGHTQAAVAAATGISQAQLSKLENDEAQGSVATLSALAAFLKVTVDDLLRHG